MGAKIGFERQVCSFEESRFEADLGCERAKSTGVLQSHLIFQQLQSFHFYTNQLPAAKVLLSF